MSSFYHSLFIALYILGTSASFQNDESGSDQLSTPTTEEKKNEPFLPVDKEWQIEMCKKLKFEWVEPCIQENHEYFLGIPNKLVKIRKDGNCFFSSLSYWISGTTKYGQILRKNIIDFAKTSEIYKTMTFDDERDERIEKMYRSVEFAESPKIFAAADYLKTSICVYSDDSFLKGWHFFAANNLLNTKEDEKCLYIINHGEHYDVVVDTFPIGTEPLDDTEIKKDDGTIVDDLTDQLSYLNVNTVNEWDQIKNDPRDEKYFLPVGWEWQLQIADLLKLDFNDFILCRTKTRTENQKLYDGMRLKTIFVNENKLSSFFSALSYWISGSTCYSKYIKIILSEYLILSYYYREFYDQNTILKRKNALLNNDLLVGRAEMYVAAEFLQTSIYVYANKKWFFISRDGQKGEMKKEQCLYLENPKKNWFNVVIDVVV
ncbi:uncharacterized protein LOC126895268 isoform X2 [Daktulosphaira vitifoliae]|uniref:uncharacterized protein LOC126895268 isoform X2 n=1 Tax=Daktulosphaira vitifoliae TaxID=58002 RepID=UPI0021AAB453|nr:uncharacterized protein LOC126895268 isoform X2 [Daktulosphaira vitifoliae]